jgi:hypothetical protein
MSGLILLCEVLICVMHGDINWLDQTPEGDFSVTSALVSMQEIGPCYPMSAAYPGHAMPFHAALHRARKGVTP